MPNAEKLIKKQQEETKKKLDEQVAKCSPVVFNILRLIAENAPKLDISTQDELNAVYSKSTTDGLLILKDAGLTIEEVEWVLNRTAEVVNVVKGNILKSLNVSSGKVLEATFGKNFSTMTLDDWDNILIKANDKSMSEEEVTPEVEAEEVVEEATPEAAPETEATPAE